MINTYGYMVIRNKPNKLPLTVVQVTSEVYAGFNVFASALDGLTFIENLKDSLLRNHNIDLRYDSEFNFASNIVKKYQDADILRMGNGAVYVAYD